MMTIERLYELIVASAGESDSAWTGAECYDRTFEELGYDSLALIETMSRIEQEYGVSIPDEQVADLQTPRAVLSLVNKVIGG
ncbi:acyl carrier protein [Nocardia sp. CC227C]|uniref:acyl carrier protein n=1 Tax=Nocardia sp. CC227C TaxID=3044562 RepID=UPI00278C7CD7|nr:acyl carrier protein [Nocardia sp. CC227C]